MKDQTKRDRLLPANAKAVKAARAIDGRETEYRIKGAPGLVLRVRPPPAELERDAKAKCAATFYVYFHTGKGDRRKLRKIKLGSRDVLELADACDQATAIMRNVALGRDPAAERTSTVDALLDDHVKHHVSGLRSADEVERCFDVYVRPEIGAKSIYTLKRGDVTAMLDKVAAENGPVMADRVLAHLRKAFNWHAARDDNFNSPIVIGMARTSVVKRARKRRLDDQEIRDVWKALDIADVPSCFPALVRFLLLSARRSGEVTGMQWSEIEPARWQDADTMRWHESEAWIIPAERGEKQGHKVADRDGAMCVPLTPAMLALMGERQKRGLVFHSGNSSVAFTGWGKAKQALDKAIADLRKAEGRDPMPPWQLGRDIRRTARSLMSRARTPSKHAELALGHVLKGVERTYDRYEFLAERKDALERLGKLVAAIVAGKAEGSASGQASVSRLGPYLRVRPAKPQQRRAASQSVSVTA